VNKKGLGWLVVLFFAIGILGISMLVPVVREARSSTADPVVIVLTTPEETADLPITSVEAVDVHVIVTPQLPDWVLKSYDNAGVVFELERVITFEYVDGISNDSIHYNTYRGDLPALLELSERFLPSFAGGCRWETWYTVIMLDNPWCVAENPVLELSLGLAYCRPFEDGTMCKRGELTVFIPSNADHISFSAKDQFLPEYREWVQQLHTLLEFEEALPAELQPNWSYTIKK
jgi:hypothetical protein